jgi:TonB-linked SusC/RagA family outer membrane protein
MFAIVALQAQQTVKGTVTDAETGEALEGVQIVVEGTTVGKFTDSEGTYTLLVPAEGQVLVFTYVGKLKQEVPINGQSTIDIQLGDDVLQLEEVVVTAIGIEREKKSLGYAVQEVGGDALVNSREVNLMNALSSKVAGLQVNASNGMPGAGSYILLRGSTSFRDINQPLIVIDGVPVDNSTNYTGDPNNTARNNNLQGVSNSNRGIDINPNDIEDVTVLKGPAAAALYGSRAANGAIMITTKRGGSQNGRMKVGLKSSLGFNSVNRLPEVQKTYAQGSQGIYNRRTSLSWGPRIDTLGTVINPVGEEVQAQAYENDFMNFFQTGLTWDNNVSFSGGNENNNFYASLGNTRQTGIIPNTDFNRFSARFNAESRVARKLRAKLFANYTNSGGNRIQQGSNLSNPLFTLWPAPASWDLYGIPYETEDGRMQNYRNFFDNPRWAVEKNPHTDDVNRFLGNMQLIYDPAPWMNVMYRIGTDFYSDRRKQIYAIGSWEANTIGRVYEEQLTSKEINSDLILNFNKDWNEDINTTLTVGNNINMQDFQRLFVQGDGLTIPGFYNLANATALITTESITQARSVSAYFDARFSFRNYLFLSVTGRNDWSSTLPKESRSFFYPSVSAGFVFSDAFGFDQEGALPYGKIRVSWAQTGNGAPAYSTQSVYLPSSPGDGWTNGVLFPLQGTIPGFTLASTIGNPNLTNELTEAFEVGIDLKFFQNRLGVDAAYYSQKSTNQIFSAQFSAAAGAVARVFQGGVINNDGIEITAYGTPIKTADFSWDISANFTRNVSIVESIDENISQLPIAGFTAPQTVIAEGQPFGAIFGSGYQRDDNGNILIDDDPTSAFYGYPMIDLNNKIIGNTQPDFLANIRNTFSYKGFSLTALLDIRRGGDVYAGTTRLLRLYGAAKETEDRTTPVVLEGVKASDGGANDIAVPLNQTYWQILISNLDEANVFAANWVRLREVSLSYTLPRTILEGSPFSEVSIAASGRNLWLSTDYPNFDPEVSLTGANFGQGLEYMSPPNTKGYTFSINLSF